LHFDVALLDIRQRSGYLFLSVMLGHILLISAQVNSRSGVPVLEAVTFGVFAEVERVISSGFSSVRHVWSGYAGLRNLKSQNDALTRDLEAAKIALQQQRTLADRTRSLERLLDLRDRSKLNTLAAEIIAAGATPDFRTLTIDKGTREGVRADMAVIAPPGVVGRVVMPSTRAAKVQLLVDRNAAAGALIERSRAQGVVMGGGDDRLRMDYVSEVADVIVGDLVVTSGIDGIYPKGYVIGQVESVEKSGTAYKTITVKPAVDFTSLEEVLVVLTPTPARETAVGSIE
jgi:rod shape-determining protein MreC